MGIEGKVMRDRGVTRIGSD